jgi:hypothetical protein
MTREESKLVEIVSRIVDIRRTEVGINPSWIATEALKEIDPSRRSVDLVYLGCHLQLRQIARQVCRTKFEPHGEPEETHDLFPDLQWRYPTARAETATEPEYVLLEHLTPADVAYNVRRLRQEAEAKLAHADALEAWWRARGRRA